MNKLENEKMYKDDEFCKIHRGHLFKVFNNTINLKTKFSFFLYFICLSLNVCAQLDGGSYNFANDEIKFSFVVEDFGWEISSATITILKTDQKFYGQGKWFKLNPNGIDEDYDGPMGWYQLETDICFFEFDEPKNNTLVLSQGECANGMKSEVFELYKNYEKNIDESSDYFQITNEITSEFNIWLKQGEFEKSKDHAKRLEKLELQFYDICDSLVKKKLSEKVPYVEGENWYKDNSGDDSFVLFEYNPNEEFFPFYFRYKKMEFRDSIYIPFIEAKKFKERTGYHSISYPIIRKQFVLYRDNIYPTIILFKNIDDKKPIEVSLNFPSDFDKIQISTSQLSLTNYQYQNITYDFETFKITKKELLMKYALKHEENNEFGDAIDSYQKILKIDGNSIKVLNKIDSLNLVIKKIKMQSLVDQADSLFKDGNFEESLSFYLKAKEISNNSIIDNQIIVITKKLNEIKRKTLIDKADKLFALGKISESLLCYKEANSIIYTTDLEEQINEINANRNESILKHQLLVTKYETIRSALIVSKDQFEFNSLEKIKKGYGLKYNICLDSINFRIENNKSNAEVKFAKYLENKNLEVWSDENEKFLSLVNSNISEIQNLKSFQTIISNAIQNKDNHFLKILKEENTNVIIETLIKTN